MGVEARGAPARGGLRDVPLGRSQHAETAGKRRGPEETKEELLRLQERAARSEPRKSPRAQQHVERDALVLQRGDPRLDAGDHVALAHEDRRAVGQARDEDLVVAVGRERRDLVAAQPVERARLDDLHVAAEHRRHVRHHVTAG